LSLRCKSYVPRLLLVVFIEGNYSFHQVSSLLAVCDIVAAMTLMEKLEADIDDLRAKIKRYEDDPTFDRKDPAYLAWLTEKTGLETERRERAQANALPAPAAVPQGMTLIRI
jgi:hypothetical protein